MPIIHACSREGCPTLTMGTLCLDHEREQDHHRERRLERRALRLLAPVAPAAALLAAAAAGVLLKTRLS